MIKTTNAITLMATAYVAPIVCRLTCVRLPRCMMIRAHLDRHRCRLFVVGFFVGDLMHSDHELLEDFVMAVFDPSKTGFPLFFRGKIGGPSRFYQLPDTVVKLVRQVLL